MQFTFAFIAKKALSATILPPVLPIAISALGLLLAIRRKRAGLLLAWAGVIGGLCLTTPLTVNLIAKPLEAYAPITPQALAGAQAIVILGGGQRREAIEYRASAPNRLTLERLRYGARLARQSHLPVLVSGGAPTGEIPEATAMAESLKDDFGITPKWVERDSLDTADNARYSARLLKQAGVQRIALVTHALHMRRSEREFMAAGFEVIPAPTVFFASGPNGEEFFDFIPNMNSAYVGWYALHEWIGVTAQRFRALWQAPNVP